MHTKIIHTARHYVEAVPKRSKIPGTGISYQHHESKWLFEVVLRDILSYVLLVKCDCLIFNFPDTSFLCPPPTIFLFKHRTQWVTTSLSEAGLLQLQRNHHIRELAILLIRLVESFAFLLILMIIKMKVHTQ